MGNALNALPGLIMLYLNVCYYILPVMKNIKSFLLPFTLILLSVVSAFSQQSPLLMQNRRELFIDNAIVDSLMDVETRLSTPVSGGVAVKFDQPWEGAFCAYVSIVNDGKKFRMYYRGVGAHQKASEQVTCYAESTDGKTWTKPNLGLYKISGSTQNNVVHTSDSVKQTTHNFAVFYDGRPGVPNDEKYKAVGGVYSTPKVKRGLYRYVSPDGLHWRMFKDSSALFGDGYGMDSQNVPAWVPAEQCYAIYLRRWTDDKPGDKKLLKGMRTIARSTSKDFIHWTEPVTMSFGDTPMENLYTNATQAYFRAPQIMISMPFRFSPDSRILTDAEMRKNGISKSMWQGVSDAVLLTSRGGNQYDRKFMESFARPGLDERNWAARSSIPALGIIPTGENEMSFFLTRAYSTKDCYLERMVLRTDGFASLHAKYKPGYALTKPMLLKGDSLNINYSSSSIGYVKVVLVTPDGKEVPGFGEADALKITGDKINYRVTWKSGKQISSLANVPVRIKFILRDSDLYSFGVF